ncbi:bifunctional translation initiation inhibitor [Leptospira kobayashii]|uniref:Bifunctional translation initiation inhibitor n=1 Tax=Leptospira kobayashii TaxID=1917830 RepID=A0ABM7UJ69_9LEPT|nr:RidA family protein [Leptospira kobayashii]BDA78730.1 bifunctional translation initiation inhibitor [Leptospira kobayashii]
MDIEANLKSLGLVLPPPPKAVALYLPSIRTGNLIFTSGQLPMESGALTVKGKLGGTVTLETAKAQARIACLNAISTLLLQIPSLDQVERILKLGVYVASLPDFTEQHLVANGASELLNEIFKEKGPHARFAIGVSSLPLDACVELELTVEVKG